MKSKNLVKTALEDNTADVFPLVMAGRWCLHFNWAFNVCEGQLNRLTSAEYINFDFQYPLLRVDCDDSCWKALERSHQDPHSFPY